ncbi:MAG TPA: hypothetical protein DEO37_03460 [Aerococcaceae bacterium]|nr:hypothetical protein [Aerococcaceae bacterium]
MNKREFIVQDILSKIYQEEYDGGKLPNQRELSKLYDVSRYTIQKAIKILEEIGIVKVIQGSGIYIHEECDVMVAETTNPSLGVGYELAYAEHIGKPVIILHRTNQSQLSAMIAGTDYFDNVCYYKEIEDAIGILEAQLGKEE